MDGKIAEGNNIPQWVRIDGRVAVERVGLGADDGALREVVSAQGGPTCWHSSR
jgi:hypothetical protein